MEEDIKYWVDLADYDLETAKVMLDSGRYIYVLFMCQQAIEKILKAHVVRTTQKFPPRLHNLVRLLELSELILDEENKKFLEKLNYYYISSRYPEDRKELAKEVNKQLAREYYNNSEELFKWLKTKLT